MAETKKWMTEAQEWLDEDKEEARRAKEPYIFRFYFDADVCLWPVNQKTYDDFPDLGGFDALPISDALKQEARQLMQDWDWGNHLDNPLELAENAERTQSFYKKSQLFFAKLRQELGPEFILLNQCPYYA